MKDSQTILKLVPSLRARQLPDGRLVLTRKFMEGVSEFHRFWNGPIEVYLEQTDQESGNLDDVAISPGDLPYRISVSSLREIAVKIVADRAAVVLLSLDDFRQSSWSQICRHHGIPCAYITEYSLTTRKLIVDTGTRNPLKRVRRKLWETQEERKRRRAVGSAAGVQCNGTPTYESYRNLSSNALLFFDSRVSADLLATPDEVQKRISESVTRGRLRLLYSGRLVAAKGAEQLVDVAKQLRQRKVDFHLSICGDGELKAKIADQIRHAELDRYVSLIGVLDFRTALLPFVKSSIDLFVCCHPQGDPSCTYLETMSCGVPIAGYANEAFDGIVRHSGCGWVVPVNRPAILADQISEIGKAPASLLSMSLGAISFAKEHTFDQTFSRRINHLRTLHKERPANH